MVYHKNLLDAVVNSTIEIFGERRHADRLIQTLFRNNRKWGSRDRKFIAENIYEIVRWWRLLWATLGEQESLDRAIIYRLLGALLVVKGLELPKFPEFSNLNKDNLLEQYNESRKIRKLRESIPDWLDDLGSSEVGNWDQVIGALNKEAEVVLRVNRITTSKDKLISELAKEGIETYTLDWAPDALVLKERQNIFLSPSYSKGYFEVQDASSQLVAPFIEAEEGMRVIDACAGAGGKSLHLANLMNNKGKIIALDIHDWKLSSLKTRAKRDKITVIEPRLIQSNKVIKRLKESADRVLLDVPCSGLGVLRRNPDTKWKLNPGILDELKKNQSEILDKYSTMVKPGGNLIYTTCSILPSENQQQVENFLAGNKAFSLQKMEIISPVLHGYDGFFMASMKKV
ncbi:MAG: RsmB/NOP family class I SAM-dependent RNA methyltransferase [Ignavibacteriaceae bacterium]